MHDSKHLLLTNANVQYFHKIPFVNEMCMFVMPILVWFLFNPTAACCSSYRTPIYLNVVIWNKGAFKMIIMASRLQMTQAKRSKNVEVYWQFYSQYLWKSNYRMFCFIIMAFWLLQLNICGPGTCFTALTF